MFPLFGVEDLPGLVGRLGVVEIPPDGLHAVLVAAVPLQDLRGRPLPLLLLLPPLPLLLLLELADLRRAKWNLSEGVTGTKF